MSGDSGPSSTQKAQQAQSLALAQRAEERELARDRALQTRILARQRARRFGQTGRRTLAFNPGAKDLGTTPNNDPAPNPAAAGGKKQLSGTTPATVATNTRAPAANRFRPVSA